MKTKNKIYLEKAVGISIFSALAFIIALVCNVIPPVAGFLSLDAKDAVISIAAFIYGPIAGTLIALIAALVEFLTFSTTGWYGLIMNFASSAVFATTAALIYKFRRSVNGALIGFFAAVTATTAIMLCLNYFITPIYLYAFVGLPEAVAVETVIDYLPRILLPFNAAKSLMNAALAMFLYKPLLLALSRAGLLSKKKVNVSFNRSTVIIITTGALFLAASIITLIIIW